MPERGGHVCASVSGGCSYSTEDMLMPKINHIPSFFLLTVIIWLNEQLQAIRAWWESISMEIMAIVVSFEGHLYSKDVASCF